MTRQEVEASAIQAEAGGPVPGWGWTETALSLMVLVWGVNYSVVKHALAQFDPLAFNALRFCIASVFVWMVMRAQGDVGRPERRDVLRLIGLGILGNVIYQGCFVLGLARTPAGSASLILAVSPVMTAMLSALTGHERPGWRTWGGAAVAIGGIALITGSGIGLRSAREVTGDVILIFAAFAWAAYTVSARPMVRKYGAVRTTAWTMWTGAVGLVALGSPALVRQDWGKVDVLDWAALVFSALFAIGLAYLIWYRGVERIGNTRTAIFSNLSPVVAVACAAVLLHERPSEWALLGAILTLGGVMIVRSDPGHASPAARIMEAEAAD
ncbi:DMT family transporter [Longimicrobium sp.]|uniref:DMT family transporter n=1 Tax=Longimicrobium sp. TaxID=2029185 RepID=UPI002C8D539E|nr:DMT family transporter [Longimicrobium sp.]HSU13327.1 DMT family transporter [Longimicrobium sp.]